MIKSKPPPPQPSPALGPTRGGLSLVQQESYSLGASLDIPRNNPLYNSPPSQTQLNVSGGAAPDGYGSRSGTPKLRPVSMGPLSPPRSPPLVTIDSPRSPPKFADVSPSPHISARPSRE